MSGVLSERDGQYWMTVKKNMMKDKGDTGVRDPVNLDIANDGMNAAAASDSADGGNEIGRKSGEAWAGDVVFNVVKFGGSWSSFDMGASDVNREVKEFEATKEFYSLVKETLGRKKVELRRTRKE